MRHRKNNYGFNNFSFIKRKKISKYLIVICAILVTSLTIGFASFSSSLVMKNIAMIRIDKTVRLTGIKVNSTNGGAISRTEEYNVSNMFGDVVLPSKDSYVKYEVDITNLGNVKMGALPPVTHSSICTAVTTATTGNVPTGSFNYGDEYKCKVGDSYTNTFFVLENNTDTVSLIMKENYTDSYVPETLSWCTDGGTNNTTCKNITATGSDAPTGKDYLGHIKSIFNKEGVEVSFSSASQIATASGKTFNNSSILGLPTWLYGNLSSSSEPYGYWTTTPLTNSTSHTWYVYYAGALYNSSTYVSYSFYNGVRPIITLSKSSFSTDTNLDYTIDNYNENDVISVCDGDNCTNGVTKKIYITIKYKDGIDDSLITSEPQSFNIGFEYKQIFKVTYDGVTCTDCNTEAIEGNTYTANIDLGNPKIVMGDTVLTKDVDYIYDTTTKLLTIPNVSGDITIGNGVKTYSNGEIVYFDVDKGTTCTDYTDSQSNAGVKSGCMKFYAFNDDGGDKLNLILDHNTTSTIAWNSSGSSTTGPKEVLEQLKTDTSSWIGVETPTSYSLDQSAQPSQSKYNIDYADYKARLISAGEIAKITGNTTFNEVTDPPGNFYFETNTTTASSTCYYNDDDEKGNTSGCKYGWLFDRTSSDCKNFGCLYNSDVIIWGYWTTTSCALTKYTKSDHAAWAVSFTYSRYSNGSGTLVAQTYQTKVSSSGAYGVRPVIEVLKSNL